MPNLKLNKVILMYLCLFLLAAPTALADTLAQITEVQEQNKSAQQKFTVAAVQLAVEAAKKYEHGGECQSSCPFGCCDSSEGLLYEGGLFMLLNTQATAQAVTHHISAQAACSTYNKLASTKKDCSAEVKPFDFTKPQANWFDSKGKCITSAPGECKQISLVPGAGIFSSPRVNCKNSKAKSCTQDFYSTYKTNDDGSVSIKTAKGTVKLSQDSFKDVKSLTATGVSPFLAEALMKEFKSMQAAVQKNAGPASQKLETELVNHINPNKAIDDSKKTFSSDLNSEKRAQNEKLTVNYNGEPIHYSGSDIFKIVTERYQKTAESLLP